jgi:cytochrome c oxidase cbb3-type subunit 3
MTTEPTDENVLEHNYDGIQEYDNPLPKWWVWLFYITIAYSVLYWFNVPGIGIGKGRVAAYEADLAKARAQQEALAAQNPLTHETDATLMAAMHDPATLAAGKALFTGTCFTCHAADGGGGIGPNLTDAYWIHGGTPTEILKTINAGVLDKGMPAWGQTLKPEQVRAAAVYVLTLRGTQPAKPKDPQGTKLEDAAATGAPAAGEEQNEHGTAAAGKHS